MTENIVVQKLNHALLHVQCSSSLAAELRDYFSFYVPGYKFMPAYRNRMWDGMIRLFNSQTGELPAGLYFHLSDFCKARNYTIQQEKSKYGLANETNTIDEKNLDDFCDRLDAPFELRDYQRDAVLHGLKYKRAILLSPTGSGKSFVIYNLVKYWLWLLTNGMNYPKGGRVLVIVPTTSLVEQMYSDFLQYGQSPEGMHRIYSGKDKNFDQAICISTWQSIYKLPKVWFDQFGMVVGDECHGFKSKSLMNIMNKCTEAAYRFGATGTLDGTQTHELVLQGLFGKTYKVTTTKKLQEQNTLADLKIVRLELSYDNDTRQQVNGMQYKDEIDVIVAHEKRNKFIRNLVLDLKGNTLVLYNYVENHGKPLFDLIEGKADEDRKVFFISGGTPATDREAIRGIVEKQTNAIIVASLGTFSTGINIRNLHNIVFASPSKSQIRVLQSIGRGLRVSEDGRSTQLYDLIDNIGWKSKKNFALLHAEERLKIYDREQFNHETYKVNL